MASAENSVSEPPNLKFFWGRIHPDHPHPLPHKARAFDKIMPPFIKFLATALNLQQVFTKTSLENLDVSKPQPYKYFLVYWTEEIQAKTEE